MYNIVLYTPMWLFVVLLLWSVSSGAVIDVSLAGIFNLYHHSDEVRFQQAQYLSAFLMAVEEINNKTDGLYDDLLPETTIRVAVRHGSTARDISRAAVNLVESDRVNGKIGIDAVVSTIGSYSDHDILLSEIFTHSKTIQLLTRSLNPDRSSHVVAHFPYNVNLAPDTSYQAFAWQTTLCLIGYTSVSVFYSDNMFGIQAKERLTDGSFCPIKLASAAAIKYNQRNFSREIKEAYDSLSIVQILFLDVDTAIPLLEQAYSYGHARTGHTFIFNSEILTPNLLQRMSSNVDAPNILRGVAGLKYRPQEALINTVVGQSFQERFRNQPNTLIDGICDASLDDSDGTHYLYRNADGSRCAGLNHSSFQSSSDFAPKVGLVYDGVVTLAMGLHQLIHVEHKSTVDAAALQRAIQDYTVFQGVSGYVDLIKNPTSICGLMRVRGFHYQVLGFNEGVFKVNPTGAFVYVGDWNGVNKFANKCSLSVLGCYAHYFNTHDGAFPSAIPRYVRATLPEVIKVGFMVNTFNSDGSVYDAGVQQLAAFLMAVREINNKTDGIADDLLPGTKIVVSVRSAHGMLETQQEITSLVQEDFGSGVDFIVSALGFTETYAIYSMEDNLRQPIAHSVASHYLLDDQRIAPDKIQMLQSPSLYGTALQSLICDEYNYRKISIFVSNSPTYQNALASLLNIEFCEFNIFSQYTVSSRQTSFQKEIAHAKSTGARIFVLLTDPFVSFHLVHEGSHAGLFGEDRQVFGHADIFEFVNTHNHDEVDEDDMSLMYHGFIGVRELPNYALSLTPPGKAFVSRWRQQRATHGSWVEGEKRCDMSRDDNDAFLLYASPPNFRYTYNCAGLDFAAFDEDGHDIVNYVPHTYDTALVLAYAYHDLIYYHSVATPSIVELQSTIYNNVEFDGVSGAVDVQSGEGDGSHGTRRIGIYYEVVNFVGVSHHDRTESFSNVTAPDHHRIGIWELNSGYIPCYNDETNKHRRHLSFSHHHLCDAPIYNSHNGKQVSESPAPVVYYQNRIGFQVVGTILALIAIPFLLFVSFNWEVALIQHSLCGMLPSMGTGCLICAGRIMIMSVKLNEELCVLQMLAYHSAFLLFYLPVILCSARVYLRSLYPTKLRKSLSRSNIRMLHILLTTFLVIYVSISTSMLYGSYFGYETISSKNQAVRYPSCLVQQSWVSTFPLFVEGALLVLGLICAYGARDVRDATLESKVNVAILSVFCGMVFVVLPVWLLLDVEPNVRVNILEYNIAGVMIFCLVLLYVNRRDMLKKYLEDEEYFNPSVKEMPAPVTQSRSVSGVYCVFKTLPREEQVQMCKVQISQYVEMLNELQGAVRSGISLTYDAMVPTIEVSDKRSRFLKGNRSSTVIYNHCDVSSLAAISEE